MKLDELIFGYAAAIVSAAAMLLLGIAGNLGIYTGAAGMMRQSHMFFSMSIAGIAAGMIEAAVVGFIFGYAFSWIYNQLLKCQTKKKSR
jgi:hypothetical protein